MIIHMCLLYKKYKIKIFIKDIINYFKTHKQFNKNKFN